MRTLALPGLLLLLACVVWVACARERQNADPTPLGQLPQVELIVGATRVRAHVVLTYADRKRGLGGVRQLANDEGMLFVYRDLERRQFWMRDCWIPLDIAFLGEDGHVLQLETLSPPAAGTERTPRTRLSPPSAYVLEVEAGFFQRHGLGVGTVVQIPAEVRRTAAE